LLSSTSSSLSGGGGGEGARAFLDFGGIFVRKKMKQIFTTKFIPPWVFFAFLGNWVVLEPFLIFQGL
jgi:hypothetical protein